MLQAEDARAASVTFVTSVPGHGAETPLGDSCPPKHVRRRGRPRAHPTLVVEVDIPAKVDPVARRRFLEVLADLILDDAERSLDETEEDHSVVHEG
ncbi:MAG TPA: hypothetical protein PK280_10420 [Planctomycetota bacterium]|nr:hypothetical protein [Planctomycetota bacterium]